MRYETIDGYCSQWFKDTNLKANHNIANLVPLLLVLFPMVQRY